MYLFDSANITDTCKLMFVIIFGFHCIIMQVILNFIHAYVVLE